jgi:YbgC/YbaW family acyl-CoA thioester hydrolase
MSRPTDAARAPLAPFVHIRRVSWADTDAARIAYTARFLDFAMEAVEAWWRERMELDWYEMNVDYGIGTPFVHASLDFRSPVTPRDTMGTRVLLTRLGGSSLRFVVAGRVGDRLVYEGTLVCAFVDAKAMKPIRVPEHLRQGLEREAAIAAVAG